MKRFFEYLSALLVIIVAAALIKLSISLAVALLPPLGFTNDPDSPQDQRAIIGYVAGIALVFFIASRKKVIAFLL